MNNVTFTDEELELIITLANDCIYNASSLPLLNPRQRDGIARVQELIAYITLETE